MFLSNCTSTSKFSSTWFIFFSTLWKYFPQHYLEAKFHRGCMKHSDRLSCNISVHSCYIHFLSSSLTSLYRCSLWASVSPQTPHVTSPCLAPPQSPLPAATIFLLHVFYIHVLHSSYFGHSLWPAGLNPGPQ